MRQSPDLRLVLWIALPLLAGCRQEMASQPSYRPLRPSIFFADGMSARSQVEGTIARGQLNEDVLLHTGKWPVEMHNASEPAGIIGAVIGNPLAAPAWTFDRNLYADVFPEPISRSMLERGQERFNIYCAVCHDRAGTGRGVVVQRGFTAPPSYHTDFSRGMQRRGIKMKLRDAPVGYYFDVITRGYGAMPDHAEQIAVKDRWAIIAYIRALQLSQNASLSDVQDEAEKNKLRGEP